MWDPLASADSFQVLLRQTLKSHLDSADRFLNGDYLLSIRFTNTVYKVSRQDGRILWRLDGSVSDYAQDFNFSGQHDGRIVSQNDSVTVISIFDTASVNTQAIRPTAATSSLKVVALYERETPRRAMVNRVVIYEGMTNGDSFLNSSSVLTVN